MLEKGTIVIAEREGIIFEIDEILENGKILYGNSKREEFYHKEELNEIETKFKFGDSCKVVANLWENGSDQTGNVITINHMQLMDAKILVSEDYDVWFIQEELEKNESQADKINNHINGGK